VLLESPAYFQGAFDWRLRTAVENERHAVTDNQPQNVAPVGAERW